MLRSLRAVAVAVAAGVVVLAGAGSAGAVKVGTLSTPTGSGSMAVAATAGSPRIVVNNSIALSCTSAATNGNIATGAYGTMYPFSIGSIELLFQHTGGTDCTGPSGFLFNVTCTSTANAQVASAPVGGPPAVTPGRITNISCVIRFTALGCQATMTGTVPTSYTNPTSTTAGRLTVIVAGQALTVSGSTCPPAVLPNGSAQFGGTGAGSLGLVDLAYTLSGASSGHPFISL